MKFIKSLFVFIFVCILAGVGSLYCLYKYIEPQLPDVNTLKDVRLQTPMQIYSADNQLIAQFGEKRRIPLQLSAIPPQMIQAFIATEDSRFYEHHGIDPVGIFRAASVALLTGHASQGASTITQQLARNFFLSPEKTLMRKIREALLAIRIEQLLNKNEIMALYLNKIYLGSRAYGVGAAAEVYFGKSVAELNLNEIAVIAGLPKAPSTFNPIYSNQRALARRNTVLSRMLSQHFITQQQYHHTISMPIVARYHGAQTSFSAHYITEMVRQEMVNRYGDNAYTDGYKVYTTITKPLQQAATESVRNNIINYDMRHGYRGPQQVLWHQEQPSWSNQKIHNFLQATGTRGPLVPAVVTYADNANATVMTIDDTPITLNMDSVRWARPFKTDNLQDATPTAVNQVIQPGQLIWIRQVKEQWLLGQIPEVNSALVSLDSRDGSIKALVGGFDFSQSMFNRATQAIRQLGSNIKPFLYTAAMDKGLTLATILNDMPIVRWDAGAGADWRPHNSPDTYLGPIRLREGLGLSKNVVMVRAMRAMGVAYAAAYLERFGFPSQNIIHTESLALGAASFTPLQVARGYAALSNGGYLIKPWFIKKIVSDSNQVLFEEHPQVACSGCDLPTLYSDAPKSIELNQDNTENVASSDGQQVNHSVPEPALLSAPGSADKDNNRGGYAPHVISTQLSFLIKSAMNSNIYGEPGWMGTAWRAGRDIQRNDIGGKTGTTNNSKDAWFSGFGPNIATTVWFGFDNAQRALGRTSASGVIKDQISGAEGGAKSAQPAWDSFMKIALNGVALQPLTPPPGITTVTIDRTTGKLSKGGANSRQEYFITGTEPKEYSLTDTTPTISDHGESEDLF